MENGSSGAATPAAIWEAAPQQLSSHRQSRLGAGRGAQRPRCLRRRKTQAAMACQNPNTVLFVSLTPGPRSLQTLLNADVREKVTRRHSKTASCGSGVSLPSNERRKPRPALAAAAAAAAASPPSPRRLTARRPQLEVAPSVRAEGNIRCAAARTAYIPARGDAPLERGWVAVAAAAAASLCRVSGVTAAVPASGGSRSATAMAAGTANAREGTAALCPARVAPGVARVTLPLPGPRVWQRLFSPRRRPRLSLAARRQVPTGQAPGRAVRGSQVVWLAGVCPVRPRVPHLCLGVTVIVRAELPNAIP
jgi:hypothetical protein